MIKFDSLISILERVCNSDCDDIQSEMCVYCESLIKCEYCPFHSENNAMRAAEMLRGLIKHD